MRESDHSVKQEGEAIKTARRLTRRPIEMKRWIVEQTLAPGASVATVARRHGVNANQVFDWRKQYREGRLVNEKRPPKAALPGHDPATSAGQALIRIGVIDHDGGLRPLPPAAGAGLAGEASDPSVAPSRPQEPAVPENGNAAASGIIEIELPNGIKVRVAAGIDGAALRRALSAASACSGLVPGDLA